MTTDTRNTEGGTSRATVYKALAECYHRPTDQTLRFPLILVEALAAVCPSASDAAAAMLQSERLEDLSRDYAQLFIGPFGLAAPPYGSVYLDGEQRCMGESTLEAARRYAEFELGAAEDFHDALDHIAVELEFMHFLVTREIDAHIRTEDPEAVHEKQRVFLETHLAAWVPEFSGRIEVHAQTSFYHNLAVVTRLFIASDLERLKESRAVAA
jgi:DMSO reductase family type II enzyme chaperone